MSKRKSGLNINGILLLDKRLGVSSNKALQEVRRLFNANKAGHTGSLDPLATGLLPLCFGEATKVSAMMLDDNKRYQVVIQLGIITETGDLEGNVLETKPVPALSLAQIQLGLEQFTGAIEQVPPMYSALKHNGQKLYELARAGKTIERVARKISIIEIKLLQQSIVDDCLSLEVYCSKGTYIRSLAEDLGNYFGCGGTVKALRRIQSGQFSIADARTIEQLSEMTMEDLSACLLAVDKPLEHLPGVELSEQQASSLRLGQACDFPFPVNSNDNVITVRMYHAQDFLGLGEMLLNGKLAPKKIFNLNNA